MAGEINALVQSLKAMILKFNSKESILAPQGPWVILKENDDIQVDPGRHHYFNYVSDFEF